MVQIVLLPSEISFLLGSAVVGVYLFGSAVMGGLHIDSDVDILVILNSSMPEGTSRIFTERLLHISGKVRNPDSVRPLEVTSINHEEIVPWRYPPKREYIYGEWLRDEYEKGLIPEPSLDPDPAIILSQVIKCSIPLLGLNASDTLEPVPVTDVRRAIMESLPGLVEGIKGDERNVILTLARMWLTLVVGDISPKDVAAEWAIPRLPKEHAKILDLARNAYRGEYVDKWDLLDAEVKELVNYLQRIIKQSGYQ